MLSSKQIHYIFYVVGKHYAELRIKVSVYSIERKFKMFNTL